MAVEPTYFIDIIFPDYDEKRPCRFFEVEEETGERMVKLREVEGYSVNFSYLL